MPKVRYKGETKEGRTAPEHKRENVRFRISRAISDYRWDLSWWLIAYH
jgi:hypothetical protein